MWLVMKSYWTPLVQSVRRNLPYSFRIRDVQKSSRHLPHCLGVGFKVVNVIRVLVSMCLPTFIKDTSFSHTHFPLFLHLPGSISSTYLRAAFTPLAPQSVWTQSSRQYLFMLLGSARVKTVHRALMKLSLSYTHTHTLSLSLSQWSQCLWVGLNGLKCF